MAARRGFALGYHEGTKKCWCKKVFAILVHSYLLFRLQQAPAMVSVGARRYTRRMDGSSVLGSNKKHGLRIMGETRKQKNRLYVKLIRVDIKL